LSHSTSPFFCVRVMEFFKIGSHKLVTRVGFEL
jgi:hypothetical protein